MTTNIGYDDKFPLKLSPIKALTNLVFEIAEGVGVAKCNDQAVDSRLLLDAIFKLKQIEAAARNLAKVKGRHNSEIAMNQLLETLK